MRELVIRTGVLREHRLLARFQNRPQRQPSFAPRMQPQMGQWPVNAMQPEAFGARLRQVHAWNAGTSNRFLAGLQPSVPFAWGAVPGIARGVGWRHNYVPYGTAFNRFHPGPALFPLRPSLTLGYGHLGFPHMHSTGFNQPPLHPWAWGQWGPRAFPSYGYNPPVPWHHPGLYPPFMWRSPGSVQASSVPGFVPTRGFVPYWNPDGSRYGPGGLPIRQPDGSFPARPPRGVPSPRIRRGTGTGTGGWGNGDGRGDRGRGPSRTARGLDITPPPAPRGTYNPNLFDEDRPGRPSVSPSVPSRPTRGTYNPNLFDEPSPRRRTRDASPPRPSRPRPARPSAPTQPSVPPSRPEVPPPVRPTPPTRPVPFDEIPIPPPRPPEAPGVLGEHRKEALERVTELKNSYLTAPIDGSDLRGGFMNLFWMFPSSMKDLLNRIPADKRDEGLREINRLLREAPTPFTCERHVRGRMTLRLTLRDPSALPPVRRFLFEAHDLLVDIGQQARELEDPNTAPALIALNRLIRENRGIADFGTGMGDLRRHVRLWSGLNNRSGKTYEMYMDGERVRLGTREEREKMEKERKEESRRKEEEAKKGDVEKRTQAMRKLAESLTGRGRLDFSLAGASVTPDGARLWFPVLSMPGLQESAHKRLRELGIVELFVRIDPMGSATEVDFSNGMSTFRMPRRIETQLHAHIGQRMTRDVLSALVTDIIPLLNDVYGTPPRRMP